MNNNCIPLLTVHIFAYNHENYIAQAIESVLMQKTNFQFEIYIGEDGSKDSTLNIIKEYKDKYGVIINLFEIDQSKKIYRDGKPTGLFITKYLLEITKSKYIAWLDGDDYWTDPEKLQKQVDFLEANEDFAICFHNAIVYNEEEQKKIFEQPGIERNTIFTIENFLEYNPIATASVVFRATYIKQIPAWFAQSIFVDYAFYLLILIQSQRKVMYLKDTMSVYRIHKEGIHGVAHLTNLGLVNAYKQHLQFWKILKKYLLQEQYKKEINNTIAKDYSLLIKYLLLENNYKESLKYNSIFLFRLNFSFIKENVKIYCKILRQKFDK